MGRRCQSSAGPATTPQFSRRYAVCWSAPAGVSTRAARARGAPFHESVPGSQWRPFVRPLGTCGGSVAWLVRAAQRGFSAVSWRSLGWGAQAGSQVRCLQDLEIRDALLQDRTAVPFELDCPAAPSGRLCAAALRRADKPIWRPPFAGWCWAQPEAARVVRRRPGPRHRASPATRRRSTCRAGARRRQSRTPTPNPRGQRRFAEGASAGCPFADRSPCAYNDDGQHSVPVATTGSCRRSPRQAHPPQRSRRAAAR